MIMYDGQERRHSDALFVKLLEEQAATRAESAAYRKELNSRIDRLLEDNAATRARVDAIQKIIERGKVVVWVLSGLGAGLLWLETKYETVTKFVKFLAGNNLP